LGSLSIERIRGYFHAYRHQLAVGSEVVNLIPITPPAWLPATVTGNLKLAGCSRETSHINLIPTRLVRCVCDPSAVRGELSQGLVEFGLQKRDRLPYAGSSRHGEHPQIESRRASGFRVQNIPSTL